jgi:hypothetical protein
MQHPEDGNPCANRACLAPHAVDARICTTHLAELLRALHRIVRVEDDLDVVISRQARLNDHTGGGHPAERPLPFHWDGADAQAALVNTLTTWTRAVAAEAGWTLDLDTVVVPPPPRHGRAAMVVVSPTPRTNRHHPVAGSPVDTRPVVEPATDDDGVLLPPRRHDDPAQLPYRPGPAARAAQWLLDHPKRLKRFADLGELAEEIVYISGRTQHVIDRAPTRWYLGLCDHCERALYCRPELPRTVCANPDCLDEDGRPHVYDVADRRAWLNEAANDYMVTAAEASRAVPLLANDTTGWSYSTFRDHLGRAIPADRTHPDGHPRYRLGDCIRWAEDRAAAAATRARQIAG